MTKQKKSSPRPNSDGGTLYKVTWIPHKDQSDRSDRSCCFWLIHSTPPLMQSHPSQPPHTHTHRKKGYFVSWRDNSYLHQHESVSVSLHLRGIKELACLHRDVSCSTWWRWMLFFFFYPITHLEHCRLQSTEFTQAARETAALCSIFKVGKKFPGSFFFIFFFGPQRWSSDGEVKGQRRWQGSCETSKRVIPTAPSEHFIMKRRILFLRH